jgi:hypothetical protein
LRLVAAHVHKPQLSKSAHAKKETVEQEVTVNRLVSNTAARVEVEDTYVAGILAMPNGTDQDAATTKLHQEIVAQHVGVLAKAPSRKPN